MHAPVNPLVDGIKGKDLVLELTSCIGPVLSALIKKSWTRNRRDARTREIEKNTLILADLVSAAGVRNTRVRARPTVENPNRVHPR